MMKISNETKIGALTAVSITLLILGFNFLKGKNIFVKKSTMYVTFKRVEGLNVADGIKINGLRVGAVEGLEEKDMNLSEVVVAFQLLKQIYAKIVATPLGSTAIVITMGSATTFLNEGDTLKGMESKSMVEDLKETLQPTVENVNRTLATLDSTIRKIGNVFDAEAKKNIGSTLEELALTTSRLNALLEPNNGSLAQTLENVKGFTGNLKQNNDSITAVVNNLTKASRDLASADISKTISSLEKATTTLNTILAGIKDGKGSLGKFATDEQLYKNLNSTSNSLNTLLQDLRLHPKRYVQVSVFGKKDKTAPLMAPLPDSLSKQ
jgi:phospholipid/cholesterol/gamma-HCH transport system substrate-binding protein